jgi:hypothetical protein
LLLAKNVTSLKQNKLRKPSLSYTVIFVVNSILLLVGVFLFGHNIIGWHIGQNWTTLIERIESQEE